MSIVAWWEHGDQCPIGSAGERALDLRLEDGGPVAEGESLDFLRPFGPTYRDGDTKQETSPK